MSKQIYLGMLRAASGHNNLAIGGYADNQEAVLTAFQSQYRIDPARLTYASLAQWVGSPIIDEFPSDLPLRLEPGAPLLVLEEHQDQQGGISYHRWGAGLRDSAVRVEDLGQHLPLDSQFGAFPMLDCPAGLNPHLFSDDRKSIFAVIDSAAYPGILGRIDSESLRAESLFQGEGGENLADVSPYLVELPSDARLLRLLFTRDNRNSSRGFYPQDATLFLHAPDGFDELRRHLRKFTKLPDNEGKWMFLRFWSSQFRDYLVNHPSPPLPGRFFDGIERAFCRMPDDRWFSCSAGTATSEKEGFMDAFSAHSRILLRQRFTATLHDAFEQSYRDPPSLARVAAYYCHARNRGYQTERAISRYVETLFIMYRNGISEAQLLAHPEAREAEDYSDTGRARTLLELVKKMETA